MHKISPNLQPLLDKAGSKTDVFKLIVTLAPDGNWPGAVATVRTAGLQLDREEPAIHALFGSASGEQITAIARLPEVVLVESEGLARAL